MKNSAFEYFKLLVHRADSNARFICLKSLPIGGETVLQHYRLLYKGKTILFYISLNGTVHGYEFYLATKSIEIAQDLEEINRQVETPEIYEVDHLTAELLTQ